MNDFLHYYAHTISAVDSPAEFLRFGRFYAGQIDGIGYVNETIAVDSTPGRQSILVRSWADAAAYENDEYTEEWIGWNALVGRAVHVPARW